MVQWSSRVHVHQGSFVSVPWPEVDRLWVARLSVVWPGSWHFGTTLAAQAHAESVPSGGHQQQ